MCLAHSKSFINALCVHASFYFLFSVPAFFCLQTLTALLDLQAVVHLPTFPLRKPEKLHALSKVMEPGPELGSFVDSQPRALPIALSLSGGRLPSPPGPGFLCCSCTTPPPSSCEQCCILTLPLARHVALAKLFNFSLPWASDCSRGVCAL